MTRETNVQFVTRLMEFSNHGAMMQMMVIDALTKYAARVSAASPAECDSAMINGAAWVSCAKELKATLDAKYGSAA